MDVPVEKIIEAILLVAGEPLSAADIARIAGIKKSAVNQAISLLRENLETSESVYHLRELNGRFELALKSEYSRIAARLNRYVNPKNLSDASLETLALIAYYQPVTRAQIARIRGVNPDSSLSTLLEAELIKKVEVDGRTCYVTTENFLRVAGISSLDELPPLKEDMDGIGKDS